jgi:hypothetical protein
MAASSRTLSFLPLVGCRRSADDDAMFAVTCPGHGSPVLLTTRHIERLANTPAGIELHWRCHCGSSGVLVTGRGAGAGDRPAETAGDDGTGAEPVGTGAR